MLIIRPERKEDYPRITEINNLAFKQENEGRLVENLRKNTDFISELSLVAEEDNEVVGHILFFPVKIIDDKLIHILLSLAPMSVHPEHQGKGIGSALVRQGLKAAKEKGFTSVIVVGHANYYPRFGFKPAAGWNIKAPFDVPKDAFMAIELTENGLKNVAGTVKYPDEFNDV
jgi:predicted N-acetyltransferase YhbS